MDELVPTIEKHKEKIRELESQFREGGNDQVSFSSEQILQLIKAGKIPQELGEWFIKNLKEHAKRDEELKKFLNDHPEIPKEERWKHFIKQGVLSPEETIKFYEEASLSGQFLLFLLKNKQLLSEGQGESHTVSRQLFNDLDSAEEFGIANCISNSLYHLHDLLENMEPICIRDSLWEAKGTTKNSKTDEISLIYSFTAQTKEAAEQMLQEYKRAMITKGLKVLLAYWIMANKFGRVEYNCQLIDIMRLNADEDREAFFSVKEKEEYWAITKMLERSKLARTKIIKTRGRKGETATWVEQPLVEILGGQGEREEQEPEDKYPNLLAVRVLLPRPVNQGFAPTVYSKCISVLNPNDIYLAFMIETRAQQMQRGTKDLRWTWDFIFELGNLQKTAKSNHRMARAKAREKMDHFQKGNIIKDWEEELTGMRIIPKERKKKLKSSSIKKST